MVQESLSDLQQEVQKFSPLQGEPFIEVAATSDFSRGERETKLEATVKELRDALEKSRQKETFLQQQNTELQLELSGQKELVERLKTELEKAKKAAIHLAQANSDLTEKINTSKQDKDKEKAKPNLPVNYKKSYILGTQPERKPYPTSEKSGKEQEKFVEDTNSQMWLLD